MDEFEIRALLSAAMAYDNRKAGEAAIAGWLKAAERTRWTYGEALNAIHDHYAESRDFIMPGDITQRLRAKRRQPGPVRAVVEPTREPADPIRVRAIVDELAGRLGWHRMAIADPQKLAQACPHCEAGPHRPCVRRVATGPRRGQYVALTDVHHSRKAVP